MALRILLSATVLEVSLWSFYFSNFANGSECKRLSAFTGKFPLSTAGLHLVLNTSCLRKKSQLVRYLLVESFHAITIDAKHLHFTVGVSSTVLFFLREINHFLETRSSFCIFEKALFLDPRDSNVSSMEARGSSLKVRVSSVNLFLSGTVHGHVWTGKTKH